MTINKMRALVGLVLLVAFVIFVGVSAVRMTYRRFQLERNLDAVEQEIASLEQERSELNRTLVAFEDFAAIERAAREVLNLQQEGENVVILLPSGEEVIQEEKTEEPASGELAEPSNPVKWWAYFFGE